MLLNLVLNAGAAIVAASGESGRIVDPCARCERDAGAHRGRGRRTRHRAGRARPPLRAVRDDEASRRRDGPRPGGVPRPRRVGGRRDRRRRLVRVRRALLRRLAAGELVGGIRRRFDPACDGNGVEPAGGHRFEDRRERADRGGLAVAALRRVVEQDDRAVAQVAAHAGGDVLRPRRATPSRPPTVQPTTTRPSASATRAIVGFVWPMGGRKSRGVRPTTRSSTAIPRSRSSRTRRSPRSENSRSWAYECSPTACPASRMARTTSGCCSTLRPTTKNVACTPCSREDVEDARRPARVRAVVEGESDPSRAARAAHDGVGEHPQAEHQHAAEQEPRVPREKAAPTTRAAADAAGSSRRSSRGRRRSRRRGRPARAAFSASRAWARPRPLRRRRLARRVASWHSASTLASPADTRLRVLAPSSSAVSVLSSPKRPPSTAAISGSDTGGQLAHRTGPARGSSWAPRPPSAHCRSANMAPAAISAPKKAFSPPSTFAPAAQMGFPATSP